MRCALKITLAASLTAFVAACSSATPAQPPMHKPVTGHPGGSFVMPSPGMRELTARHDGEPGWEQSRNDPQTHPERIPDYDDRIFVEHRHREHLRIINGRPREHTTSTSRVIRRHGTRR